MSEFHLHNPVRNLKYLLKKPNNLEIELKMIVLPDFVHVFWFYPIFVDETKQNWYPKPGFWVLEVSWRNGFKAS